MFGMFKRGRNRSSLMSGWLEKAGLAIDKKHRVAAEYMNAKARKLTTKQLLMGLICFLLLFGGWSGYIIRQAFHQSATSIKVCSIRIPDHVLHDGIERKSTLALEELICIRSCRRYLDSLQQSEVGKKVYDSIIQHHPGLLDSLAFVEAVYVEQLKKK